MEFRMMLFLLCPFFGGQFSSVSNKEREIEIPVKHVLGILGCKGHCEKRRGCVDVRYSPPSLSCSLLFKTVTKADDCCRLHFCTERFLETRKKGKEAIIEQYQDFLLDRLKGKSESREQSLGSVGAQLRFVLLKKYSNCHVKGDKANIIVKSQGPTCKVKNTLGFQKGRSYTWAARTIYCGVKTPSFVWSLAFVSNNKKYPKTKFQYERKGDSYRYIVPGLKRRGISLPSNTAFKFLLQTSTLHVFDMINNRSLKTLKLRREVDETYLRVFLSGHCHLKLIFNDMNIETC